MNIALILRLSLMMFVQYFIWGAWAPTLGNYMGTAAVDMGESINWAYSLGPISAIVAPFFMGMVADRFFYSEKVLGVACLLAGIAMVAMPAFAGTALFLPLLFVHAICYFPTLGITASLSFHHLTNQEKEFPVVRVFGTIGWVVAGWLIGWWLPALLPEIGPLYATPLPLYIGGGASIFLGVYSFTLPKTPPPSAGQDVSWRQILGVDALLALKTRSFIVFLGAAMLIFIAFGTYFPYAPRFFQTLNQELGSPHFQDPAFEMAFGQFSEIFFMLLIPFFFVRLGVKWMLMLGMLAWVLRFTVFAGTALTGTFWIVMIGILIHGVCYDFFFVTGQIYIDKKTSPAIRGQVQGILVLLTQGVGFFVGTQLSGIFVNTYGTDGTLSPENWQLFWGIFAVATLVFAIVFFALFKDDTEKESVVV
jgi:nucleoside transporter